MNMKLLAVVTSPSTYHGFSNRKTLWEEKFTGKENLFLAVNMKICGRHNVNKYKKIKGSYKYVTLDISWKFDSLEIWKSHIQSQKENLKDQERVWLPLLVSRP